MSSGALISSTLMLSQSVCPILPRPLSKTKLAAGAKVPLRPTALPALPCRLLPIPLQPCPLHLPSLLLAGLLHCPPHLLVGIVCQLVALFPPDVLSDDLDIDETPFGSIDFGWVLERDVMLNIIVLPSRRNRVCLLDPWRERRWESVMGRHPAAPHFTGVRLRVQRTNPMKRTNPVKVPGSQRPVKGKCGAKLLKSKKKYGKIRYCILLPVRGRTRCRMHGGDTPQGITSPHYRKGYSRSIPKHLQDIYEAHFQ